MWWQTQWLQPTQVFLSGLLYRCPTSCVYNSYLFILTIPKQIQTHTQHPTATTVCRTPLTATPHTRSHLHFSTTRPPPTTILQPPLCPTTPSLPLASRACPTTACPTAACLPMPAPFIPTQASLQLPTTPLPLSLQRRRRSKQLLLFFRNVLPSIVGVYIIHRNSYDFTFLALIIRRRGRPFFTSSTIIWL